MRKFDQIHIDLVERLLSDMEHGNSRERKRATDIISELFPRITAGILNQYKKYYHKTDNPVFAWWVFRFCRKKKIEIPDWVLKYFDASAESILKLCESDIEKKERKVHKALKLSRINLNQYKQMEIMSTVYFEAAELRKELKYGEKKEIYEKIAKNTKVHKGSSRLQDYITEYKKILKNDRETK